MSPPGGAFAGPVSVSIETDDPDAEILYTTDGSVPTGGVAEVYTGPFTLAASVTLRVASQNVGGLTSAAPTFVQVEPDLDGFASNLPLLILWSALEAPVWESDDYNQRDAEYTPYSITTIEPFTGGRAALPSGATLSVRAGLKIRGSTSSTYPKPPYRLEAWSAVEDADLDVALFGMPADADWVLGAPLDFDRAFMRDALSYALSNRLGRYAARTRFVEAFVAERGEPVGMDDYVGIYVVEERLERGSHRIDVTKLGPHDIVEPEVSGGYVFKEDRVDLGEQGFTAGTAADRLAFEYPFVYVSPSEDEISSEQSQYLRDLLDDLGLALVSPGFVNPTTGHHYEDLIDVDSWIDHHVLQVFSKNPDAFSLSAYFHKDREGALAAGPLWDMDRTMGCASDDRCDDPTWWDASNQTSDTTLVFDHGFWRGLFDDPSFRDRYFARLGDVLDAELSESAVDGLVDLMTAELAEAAPRNYAVWTRYPPRGGSFEAEVERLRGWLDLRRDWLRGCLDLPDPRSCQGG